MKQADMRSIREMLKDETGNSIKGHEIKIAEGLKVDAEAWKATQSTFGRMLAGIK